MNVKREREERPKKGRPRPRNQLTCTLRLPRCAPNVCSDEGGRKRGRGCDGFEGFESRLLLVVMVSGEELEQILPPRRRYLLKLGVRTK